MLPGRVEFSRTHARQNLPLSTPAPVAGAFARPAVLNYPPRIVAARRTTPLLILAQKNVRLLIHAVAILHARSVFAAVTVRDIPGNQFCARDRALINGLKLQDYLQLTAEEGSGINLHSQPNHFSAWFVSESARVEGKLAGVIAQACAAGYAVIDGTNASVSKTTCTADSYCVPMFDPQALAGLLETLLTYS